MARGGGGCRGGDNSAVPAASSTSSAAADGGGGDEGGDGRGEAASAAIAIVVGASDAGSIALPSSSSPAAPEPSAAPVEPTREVRSAIQERVEPRDSQVWENPRPVCSKIWHLVRVRLASLTSFLFLYNLSSLQNLPVPRPGHPEDAPRLRNRRR